MQRRKLQVTLETVTPLFLGGSNPRGEPELRAPSFRGALRFWLRSLLGGVLGDDTKRIFEHESKVFGSTDHASPVVVQIEQKEFNTVGYSQIAQNRIGVAYLFFGARRFGSELERKAISNGSQFTCTILLRAGAQDPKVFQAAYTSLWLLTHLGGIGMRSRKGGGNLQAVFSDWNDQSLPPLVLQAQTPEQLQRALRNGLRLLRKWAAENFGGSLTPSLQNPPAFDVLHPNFCEVFVVDRQFNDWADALNTFGQAMQQFRNRREPDYSNVKAVLQGSNQLSPVQRASFGLPIVFFFNSLYRQYIQQLKQEGKDEKEAQRTARQKATCELMGAEHDRRSSPLVVRVTKLANDKFALVITLFRSLFLPPDERLQLRHVNRKIQTDQPSDTILDEFLRHLQQQVAPFLEVTDW